MHDADVNSIPKTFINDAEFGLDSIGTVIRNNGNHPNYLIKKRYTPADYRTFPKILKINTIDELESIKELLEWGCTRVELGVQCLDDKIYKPGSVLSRISAAKNNLITAQQYLNNAQIQASQFRYPLKFYNSHLRIVMFQPWLFHTNAHNSHNRHSP
jgi:hypothetical protein